MSADLTSIYGQIWESRDLTADVDAICDFGGRFAGTPSEFQAREWTRDRLGEATGHTVRSHAFPFQGWERGVSSLTLLGPSGNAILPSTSLVLSPATPPGGIDAEVVDLGRGTFEDFAALRALISGRAVLVRHEFPFSTTHIHRRLKYHWAKEAGAIAFLIANNQPAGGVVTGSSGRGDDSDIPAVGLTHEAGERIARGGSAPSFPRVHLEIESHRRSWEAENLLVEIPGQSDEWVILCAHLDGHDLAESALDNGSGIAALLEATRRLRPLISGMRRGLRIMLFTVEEWGLWGSAVYVNGLSKAERGKIRLVINLDTVVGHPRLYALTNGRDDVERFVQNAGAPGGVPITPVRPVLGNSDHYNFFRAGVPSLRLIAGYDDASALSRHILTPGDTRDKIDIGQLRTATMATTSLVVAACTTDTPPAHFEPTADPAQPDHWGKPPVERDA